MLFAIVSDALKLSNAEAKGVPDGERQRGGGKERTKGEATTFLSRLSLYNVDVEKSMCL